jgi:hypothetical protein
MTEVVSGLGQLDEYRFHRPGELAVLGVVVVADGQSMGDEVRPGLGLDGVELRVSAGPEPSSSAETTPGAAQVTLRRSLLEGDGPGITRPQVSPG